MKLNYSEYKDKVYACWVGKNIGDAYDKMIELAENAGKVSSSLKPYSVYEENLLMAKSFNTHSDGSVDADYGIKAGEVVNLENRIVLEIFTSGRCIPIYISFPLFG